MRSQGGGSRRGHAIALLALLAAGTSSRAACADAVRELSTDRPDATESPYSVPRGWVQLEMDACAGSLERAGDAEIRTRTLAAANLKLGLAENADLQLLFEPAVRTEFAGFGAGVDGSSAASGDAGARLKWNLAGNDGGRAAHGILLSLLWSTGPGPARPRWGVALPVAVALADGVGFGAMAAATGGAPGESSLLGTATVGFDVAGPLGAFVELTAERPLGAGTPGHVSTFNAGATLGASADLQLDGGVRVGLSDAAEDLAAFVGLALRRRLR